MQWWIHSCKTAWAESKCSDESTHAKLLEQNRQLVVVATMPEGRKWLPIFFKHSDRETQSPMRIRGKGSHECRGAVPCPWGRTVGRIISKSLTDFSYFSIFSDAELSSDVLQSNSSPARCNPTLTSLTGAWRQWNNMKHVRRTWPPRYFDCY